MIKSKHNKRIINLQIRKHYTYFCWQHYMGVTLNNFQLGSININTMNYSKDMATTSSKKETT